MPRPLPTTRPTRSVVWPDKINNIYRNNPGREIFFGVKYKAQLVVRTVTGERVGADSSTIDTSSTSENGPLPSFDVCSHDTARSRMKPTWFEQAFRDQLPGCCAALEPFPTRPRCDRHPSVPCVPFRFPFHLARSAWCCTPRGSSDGPGSRPGGTGCPSRPCRRRPS